MLFSKYEATANDFIMVNRFDSGDLDDLTPEFVRLACDRRRGIGGDGLIALLPSETSDIRMKIMNSDGSVAEMCGNGIRALYLFALDQGVLRSKSASVETDAGQKTVTASSGPGAEKLFTVNMGPPTLERERIPMAGSGATTGFPVELPDGSTVSGTAVSMGNPHCVFFVESVDDYPVETVGRFVETHALFPEKTNVEFIEVLSGSELKMRVWERGVGETMACGTGACASLIAANQNGLTGKFATIHLAGGVLEVKWTEDGIILTGPATHVFEGRMMK